MRDTIDTLKNAIPNSDAIVFGKVYFAKIVPIEDGDYLHIEAQPIEVLKGGISGPKIFSIDIPDAGRDTPSVEKSKSYVFFLKLLEDSEDENARRWTMVWGVPPVLVEEENKKSFLKYMRASVNIWQRKAAPQEIKDHLLRMLNSGVAFFQSDASKVSLEVDDWDESSLAYMIELLEGKREVPFENNVDRDFIITLVVAQGSPDLLLPFVRGQFLIGISDAIYFGFSRRTDQSAVLILNKLLQDTEIRVVTGALRVAGLLRKSDIIDEYEKRLGPSVSIEIVNAIKQARQLVERDF